MILRFIGRSEFLKKVYFSNPGKKWVARKLKPFTPYLDQQKKIIDIGSGNGLITYMLRETGYDVTPLDIAEQSYSGKVKTLVYDGNTIPFDDNTFDQALILTVLHHTEHPEQIIQEAKRVAKELLIIEDIYKNPVQKWLTLKMDQFVNLGYSPCPKTNKDDNGWKVTFKELGLKLKHAYYMRVLLFFRQAYYVIE